MVQILAALLIAYGALLGVLWFVQRHLIYFPDTSEPNPAGVGVPGIQVGHIQTADGLSLLTWYLPPSAPGGCVVLYLHGNGGNIGYRAQHVRRFARLGWGVLLPEYRGYGGNPGAPSEAGLLRDARAALAKLGALGVPPERTLLWGESLGTGVAVRLAADHPVAAVLLEAPFTSLTELGQRQFPWVPVGLLLRDRFDILSRIGTIRAPVLIMQGGRDAIVPPEMGQRLLAAARTTAELWRAEAGGHNDLTDFGVVEAAADFARRRVPCASAG